MLVRCDSGIAAQAVEDKLHMVLRERCSIHFDTRVVLPIRIANPLQACFIRAIKGGRNQLFAKHIQVDVSGNYRRSPLPQVFEAFCRC